MDQPLHALMTALRSGAGEKGGMGDNVGDDDGDGGGGDCRP